MMADRRVVIVLRAERMLKPKRARQGRARRRRRTRRTPKRRPSSTCSRPTCASRSRRPRWCWSRPTSIARGKLYKTLQKHATIVECWGLKGEPRRAGSICGRSRGRPSSWCEQAVADAGQQIDPAAARLVAERAGTDIARLRGDVERLLLYTAGQPKITLEDAREVVSAETAQDDWAVTNAIQRRDAAEALRQLALALESGGVSYQILGQLAWFVRERMSTSDPRRVPAAIEALFRTDLELKSSGGDPRVLLERLVVELCRR